MKSQPVRKKKRILTHTEFWIIALQLVNGMPKLIDPILSRLLCAEISNNSRYC